MVFRLPLTRPKIFLMQPARSETKDSPTGNATPRCRSMDLMGYGRSKVPCFTLAGGITGFFTGMLIVWYMNSFDYPLIVGGKPYFSPIYPFPVFYELTILFAAFGTLFGMFFLNRLPRHNHPIFEHKGFGRTGDDRFMIVIEVEDPQFDEEETESFLKELGGKSVGIIREPIN